METNRSELIGKRFGKLVVIEYLGVYNKNSKWKCQCDCGAITFPFGNNLKKGNTLSCPECGNVRQGRKMLRNINGFKHGKHLDRIYIAWHNMKARCYQLSCSEYENYGGRGITVCDRWMNFENFYKDMGDPPKGKSLDRIDNDGNYEPGNCKWSTPKEQANNRGRFNVRAK